MELVGVGEMSDSGWLCCCVGCVVPDVGVSALSVVIVVCEGVPSDSEWDFCGTAVLFFFQEAYFRLCGRAGGLELRRKEKAALCP